MKLLFNFNYIFLIKKIYNIYIYLFKYKYLFKNKKYNLKLFFKIYV